jgi:predicted Ser/Thr protein kinase
MKNNLLQLKAYETETMTMEEYIKLAQKDPSVYASPAERMLKAIGEPKKIDTSKTPRLSRIFGNRTIRVYEAFSEFYGLEDVINRTVSFFQHAAQNLEESRQILYFLGPVGSAKSSLVERLKSLMEKEPVYILADSEGNMSPVNESPLGVCGAELIKTLKINKVPVIPSPWATKRLKEYQGDLTKFTVIKRHPNQLEQVAVSKVEPGDENCLTGNHEFLTPVGWKRMDEYVQGDLVGQYTEEGKVEFVVPTEYVTGKTNRLIHFENRSVSLSVTPSHRMIYQTRGRNGSEVLVKYHNAGEGQFSSAFAIQTGKTGQEGINLTNNEIRLQVAIAADGHFRKDNNTNYCVMELKKERKKERLQMILVALNITYEISQYREGYDTYTFYAPQRNKNLASYWKASNSQLDVICDEIVHWDGHIKSEERSSFATTKKDEADFVQYALFATGKRATLSVRKSKNENHKDLYIVNINKSATRVNYGEIIPKEETGEFSVYCFNVPSTMFVVRREGKIVVTGNNQDISALVGKVDIRKLEHYSQSDADAYSYSGGLCLSNQGMLEFVEMFKAPIKMLHPLLTATQEKNYKGTEAISAIPFDGVIVAHSNESEWDTFKNNKNNEAFLDRVYSVEVPYCLQASEEKKIYEKLLKSSTLSAAPTAPYTLELLAQFSVLTRLEEPENSNVVSKMRVYDGENVKEKDSRAKSFQEYKDATTANEGFFGISTRLAYKVLAEVYNFDHEEIAADPVHLLYVLEKTVNASRLPKDTQEKYLDYIKEYLIPYYAKKVEQDIQAAFLDSYDEFGQAMFDRYVMFADHWVQDNDYRDVDTGQMFNREGLNKELEKIEKPAEIANPKDFRHEVVNFCLRKQAKNDGKNPDWKSYEKLKRVIESSMFSKTQDLLPVISFSGQGNKSDKKKHDSFVERMKELGYTERQTRRVTEWQVRVKNS